MHDLTLNWHGYVKKMVNSHPIIDLRNHINCNKTANINVKNFIQQHTDVVLGNTTFFVIFALFHVSLNEYAVNVCLNCSS